MDTLIYELQESKKLSLPVANRELKTTYNIKDEFLGNGYLK